MLMVILGFTFIFKATQLIYTLKAVRLGGMAGKWRVDERRAVLQASGGYAVRSAPPWDPFIFRKAFCFVFGLKNEGPAGRRKTKSQMISSMSKLCYEQISIPNSNLE